MKQELEKQRELIFSHLKNSYGDQQNVPASLSRANPNEIVFNHWNIQGKSHDTYLVSVGENDFMLGINMPRPKFVSVPRGDHDQIIEFMKYLEKEGIPLAKDRGSFYLPPQNYRCDVAEFVHGYQKLQASDLTDAEIHNMAKIFADLHLASLKYPVSPNVNLSEKERKLPGGMIHADYKPANLIFEADTQKVKAVLDFELSHINSFAYDIARTIVKGFISFSLSKDGLTVNFPVKESKKFIEEYHKVRPLSKEEARFINTYIREILVGSIRLSNKYDKLFSEDALDYEIRNNLIPPLAQFNAEKIVEPTRNKSSFGMV